MPYSKLFVVLAMAVLVLTTATSSYAEEPLNILFFGNSFTYYYDLPGRVDSIAVADGHADPNIVSDLEGGQDLDYHTLQVASYPRNNVTHPSMGIGDTWDFVVMQGYSTEATHLNSDNFVGDMRTLYQAVENHNSGHGQGVVGVMYQTWARHNLVPGTFPTLNAMQAEITAGYAAAATQIDSPPGTAGPTRIATVGQGFQNANFDWSLYDNVGYHTSEKGSTVAALTMYRTLYNENVSDIPYSAVSSWVGLTESEWNDAIAIAEGAPIFVPEPATLGMLALGGLTLFRRRKK